MKYTRYPDMKITKKTNLTKNKLTKQRSNQDLISKMRKVRHIHVYISLVQKTRRGDRQV